MRPFEELIDRDDDARPIIVDWVVHASRPVEIAPCDPAAGKAALSPPR
jgi:hypothetical protein